jgi:tetratricopeptide (TPR) repeat protein
LAITGEVLCQLGPLEVPEAVRLFTERAAAVRPGFALDETTTEPVTEICRRLDGMPLALELAAARLRSMTADQIAKRLDDRFRLLTSGSRVALPRQRTLRAVVEWSWDLLEKPERVLARRLSLFPSGATVSAAEAICADELLPAEDVLYVLGSLVEKSIVDAVDGAEPRYRMLETIRVYGEERLDEADERASITRRFAQYFLEIAEKNEPVLRRAEQLQAIAAFEAEHDNMLTALRRAIDADDVETTYRFVAALLWYWVIRGFNDQPREFFADLVRFKDRIPGHARAAFAAMNTLFEAIPIPADRVDLRSLIDDCARTEALSHYPPLAMGIPMLAFFGREPDLIDRELRRAFAHPDRWAQACAHSVEGFVLDDRGDLEASERAREEALAGFREVGDRWGIAMTLAMRASAYSLRGDHERAIEGYQQGLEMARELSSRDDTVQQLSRLASERMRMGDFDGAWRDATEAERVAVESEQIEFEAIAKLTVIDLARRAGDLPQARRALDWLIASVPRMPFPVLFGQEWIGLHSASLLVSEGKPAQAREKLPSAIRAANSRQDLPDVASSAQVGARLFAAEGNAELAAWALGVSQALRGAFDAGDPELAALVTTLTATLGAAAYETAYQRGAALSKRAACDELLAEFDATP